MRLHMLWPWAWLAAPAVLAVAAAALRRRSARQAVVPSVRLWEQAAARAERSAASRRRRARWSWLCLLTGAIAVVGAISQPVLTSDGPSRMLDLAIIPGAQVRADWAGPVLTLLGRLDQADRVRIILPMFMGGAGEYVSPSTAAQQVRELAPAPVDAAALTLPPLADAQPGFVFTPIVLADPPQGLQVVMLPSRDGPVLQRFAGAILGDGRAQFLVTVRNLGVQAWRGRLILQPVPNDTSAQFPPAVEQTVELEGLAQRAIVLGGQAWDAVEVRLVDHAGSVLGSGGLVLSPLARLGVAMTGPDLPCLRRLIEADQVLETAETASQADVVVAWGGNAPSDKPALMITSSQPPPGWERAGTVESAALAEARTADHPLLHGVALADLTLRRVPAWRAVAANADSANSTAVLSVGDSAMIVAEDRGGLRRVYMSFEPWTPDGSMLSEPMVVLMLNALDWLTQGKAHPATYQAIGPLEAVGLGLVPMTNTSMSGQPEGAGRLRTAWPGPGLYRDGQGQLVAVQATPFGIPELETQGPQAAPEAIQPALPPQRQVHEAVAFWHYLAVVGVLLWGLGWWLRE